MAAAVFGPDRYRRSTVFGAVAAVLALAILLPSPPGLPHRRVAAAVPAETAADESVPLTIQLRNSSTGAPIGAGMRPFRKLISGAGVITAVQFSLA